ncbi:MAG: ASCH domain-containing protein, partial [Verrucomicrobia bacterium]|nr:ASCH domain-containing protein [Verrucomicrobiota bacterium]
QKPLPQTEDQSVVIDGNGAPVAIIETVAVFVVPFNEVPEQFAYDEGEGDRSLAYWREAHRNYFSRQPFKDRVFDERMPLVCERFRVVHIAPT